MIDLTLATSRYGEELKKVRIALDCGAAPTWWFCDKDDDTQSLTDRLAQDLKEYNPRHLYLRKELATGSRGEYFQNPWDRVIIPYADRLSGENIEKALLFLQPDIPIRYQDAFLHSLFIGIDEYREQAGDNRRYPFIFITPQRYLKRFFEIWRGESETDFPNFQGFRGRLTDIRVLDCD